MNSDDIPKEEENKANCWTICAECYGRAIKRRKLRKKVRLLYQRKLDEYNKTEGKGDAPVRPKGALEPCPNCKATGLIPSDNYPEPDTEIYPHIAIIGGGIGGIALAVACLHRGIPFTIFERDNSFDERSQGYGLTLQQASKAIQGLGISSLDEGIISTRHVVHATNGEIIVEWGARKWLQTEIKKTNKRTNVHIPRQSLRLALLEQLGGHQTIQWGHQLIDFKDDVNGSTELNFQVNGKIKQVKADLIVGADGIRSTVRKIQIGEETTPLQYLNCIVILGICPLHNLEDTTSALLDSETVFQTVNGTERIYVMPYNSDSVMWQLSFPIPENEAKKLSTQGPKSLKEEAIRRTQWHDPIPQIIKATKEDLISGYPAYDRELLQQEMLTKGKYVTLIGDAAHPMSPFKGQGANQALLDALTLARGIVMECNPFSQWREKGIRESVLNAFETEMITRTASKVKDSAEAVKLLHSDVVLRKGVEEKGRGLKKPI